MLIPQFKLMQPTQISHLDNTSSSETHETSSSFYKNESLDCTHASNIRHVTFSNQLSHCIVDGAIFCRVLDLDR